MKKVFFYFITPLFIMTIPVLVFMIFNNAVSLKYETREMDDCISLVSGQNLCIIEKVLLFLVLFCIINIILLIKFRKKFLK